MTKKPDDGAEAAEKKVADEIERVIKQPASAEEAALLEAAEIEELEST
ncbi:MAG: hypothetical protein HKN01_03845 [Acidimicrobiia bacterium]|nr:hypothetical protein [Acidimicrobiia bacterium]